MKTFDYDFSHWGASLPKVTCMCPTYGRPHLLGEAIESFIRQDYPGEKELVILNDHAEMPLCIPDLEGVRLVNSEDRFPSLGEKRNAMAAMASGEILLPWDDDDICLPNRISVTVARMKNLNYFKPQDLWWWTGDNIEYRTNALAHAMCGFSRSLFQELGGYAAMNSGEDQEFDGRVRALGHLDTSIVGRGEAFYVYRLNGVQTYHISGFSYGGGWDECAAFVSKNLPLGERGIVPGWHNPYIRLFEDQRPWVAQQNPTDERPLISICVSLKNRSRIDLGDRHLTPFPDTVSSIVQAATKVGPIELVVSDFGSDDWPLVEWLPEKTKGILHQVIPVPGNFSRGLGLNIAAAAASSSRLLLCDADILVDHKALEAGLMAIWRDAAFFPIIPQLHENGSRGELGAENYGISFVSKAIFQAAGGIPEFQSWGGEDRLFYSRICRLTTAERVACGGMVHQWHPENLRHVNYCKSAKSDYLQAVSSGDSFDPPDSITGNEKSVRVFEAEHPGWKGLIHCYTDSGRFCRPGLEGGRFTFLQHGYLLLDWDNWPSDELEWNSQSEEFLSMDRKLMLREISLWQSASDDGSAAASDRPLIMVGICSCNNYADKRHAARETWLSGRESGEDGIEWQFFVGNTSVPLEADTVVLPVNDDYDDLPAKVLAFFAHALETSNFEWLFKCDDDTYVDLTRLPELVRLKHDLVGNEFLSSQQFASGGAGYLLSRRMVEAVVKDAGIPRNGAEDVLISQSAIRQGAKILATNRLCCNQHRFPTASNNLITSHYCTPAKMKAIHAVRGFKPRRVWAKHPGWEDHLFLYSNGWFHRNATGCCGSWIAEDCGVIRLDWEEWGQELLVPEVTSSPEIRPSNYLCRKNLVETITIQLEGGMGNQMFQYAHGLSLAQETGARLLVNALPNPRPFALSHFGIELDSDLPEDFVTLNDPTPYSKGKEHSLRNMMDSKRHRHFRVSGYFQNERYFQNVAEQVRKTFSLETRRPPEWQGRIIVGVHVRRGDFRGTAHDSCTTSYFLQSMKMMRSLLDAPLFWIVSEDPEWCELNFGPSEDVRVIDLQTDLEAMRTLQSCDAFVLSNSTFGWWAAWIANKLPVILPNRFLAGDWDLSTPRWITLPPEGVL